MGKERRYERILIELVVAMAVAAIIAAVIIPTALRRMREGRVPAARRELRELAAAVHRFQSDTGRWPNRTDPDGRNDVYVLYTGTMDEWPLDGTGGSWMEVASFGRAGNVIGFLNGNLYGFPGWNGPYLAGEGISLDPWGRSYLIQVQEEGDESMAIFVISAGPDGVLQTPRLQSPESFRVEGDDIAILIK